MKDMFKAFYSPTKKDVEDAWKSKHTLFILDSSALLNIYTYKESTRNDIFELLKKLDSRVWIPYHVALEYHKNRSHVIKRLNESTKELKEKTLSKVDELFDEINKYKNNATLNELHETTSELKLKIKELIENHLEEIFNSEKKQTCIISNDEIRFKIESIFSEKIGQRPENQEELDKIYKEGEIRYKNKTPPGYKDASKENTFIFDELTYQIKYGDLIIWKQLTKKAEEKEINSIIFITDDLKDDWWELNYEENKKPTIIGPSFSLKSEIYKKSNINLFHMYNMNKFLEDGKSYLIKSIKDNSIKDVAKKSNAGFKTANLLGSGIISTIIDDIEKYKKSASYLANTSKIDSIANNEYQKTISIQEELDKNFRKLNEQERVNRLITELLNTKLELKPTNED